MNLVEWLEMQEQAGMASTKKAGTAQASTVETEGVSEVVAKPVKKKRGRPPLGDRAMTDTERKRRWRAKKKSKS